MTAANYIHIGRKTTDWREQKRDLLVKYPTCQVTLNQKGRMFGCHNPSMDLHHCVISYLDRFGSYINSLEWNIQPTCDVCNRVTRAADRPWNREAWFKHQLTVFGADRIREDLERAPEKMQLHNSDWGDAWKWLGKVASSDFEKERE